MKVLLAYFMMMAYNLTMVVGTVYLIEFYNWSPWWFCLTVLLMLYKKEKKESNV